MARHTHSAQESYVSGGLALALLEQGVQRIANDKLRFEFAFEHAWSRFGRRGDLPRIARETGADPYYQLVGDTSRKTRYLPVAIFLRNGNSWELRTRREGDSVQDCIEELEQDSGVSWSLWLKLAQDFMESYRDK